MGNRCGVNKNNVYAAAKELIKDKEEEEEEEPQEELAEQSNLTANSSYDLFGDSQDSGGFLGMANSRESLPEAEEVYEDDFEPESPTLEEAKRIQKKVNNDAKRRRRRRSHVNSQVTVKRKNKTKQSVAKSLFFNCASNTFALNIHVNIKPTLSDIID